MRRPSCARCQRPLRSCLCHWIRPTANAVDVLVLQHPLEQRQSKGSLRLLSLSLQQCRCEVGEAFDRQQLAIWIGDPSRALLLYPADADDDALVQTAQPSAAAARLVVLDGTWRKTRKLLHLNPLLRDLPRLALTAPPPSRYLIRRAQQADQRSTLEAVCQALGQREQRPGHYEPLLSAFDGWIAERAGDMNRSAKRPPA